MARSQNATQYKEAQHIGSVVLSISDYGETTYTELGIGEGFAYQETFTALDGRPDNGTKPDILNGIAEQMVEFTGTLWTLNWANIVKMRGNIDTVTTDAVTGETTNATGGAATQDNVIVKAVQTTTRKATAVDVLRWVTTPSSPTVTFVEGDTVRFITTFNFFKCTLTSGENIAPPSDQEVNSMIKYPFTFKAEEDNSLSDGENLFNRVESVALPA